MFEVTLAMPVYNVERYVERAFLSALNQTFESIEYLIIDDKGIDNSIVIVQRIISTHPRGKDVRIIDHGVNKGTGATKNSAIADAKGKYLFFMDSDDEITVDCIELLYKAMQETNVDFVVATYKTITTQGKCSYRSYPTKLLNSINEIWEYQTGASVPIHTATWNKLYKMDYLKRNNIKCISHHLCEDQVFTFLLLFFAQSVCLIPNITYNYHYNDSSTMAEISKLGYTEKTAVEKLEMFTFRKKILTNNYHAQQTVIIKIMLIDALFFPIGGILNSYSLSSKQKAFYIKNYMDMSEFLAYKKSSGIKFNVIYVISKLPEKLLYYLISIIYSIYYLLHKVFHRLATLLKYP